MKTRKSNKEEIIVQQESVCCGTTIVNSEKPDPCCEQPTDGSPCCDKSESIEVNSEKTGCC